MRKPNFLKKALLGLSVAAAGLFFSTTMATAIPYDGANTPNSPVPAFNVYTGVPDGVGNESDFLRGRVPATPTGDATTPYVDPLSASCTNGQRIQMRVYVHNGASVAGNQGGNGPSVAHGTRVKVNLPSNAGSAFTTSASITASNTQPVNDLFTLNCNGKNVRLKYVAGSASSFSKGTGVVQLGDEIVTSGVPIRSQSVPGDVWGCWDDRVYVILSAVVEEIPEEKPVTATCDLFTVTPSDGRRVRVSAFKHTAVNASLKKVVINWGDNSQEVTVNNANEVVGKTHQYAKDGEYTITAVATFGVEGKPDVTHGGAGTACVQKVKFVPGQPPVVPPTTPPTVTTTTVPGKLVETGPGAVVALFGATTAAGTVAYRWMLGRRLGDD